MSRIFRGLIVAVVAVVAITSILGWRFLAATGYFTAIRAEVPAECETLASPPGPEDIVVDRERGAGVSNYGLWDRLWVGILDLAGVWWLIRRRKRVPDIIEN